MNLTLQTPLPTRLNQLPSLPETISPKQATITWAFSRKDLPIPQRSVLVALACEANESGMARLSMRMITRSTHISETGVKEALQALETAKLLSIGTQDYDTKSRAWTRDYVIRRT
jgi:hypothetical protein